MAGTDWSAVDDYMTGRLHGADAVMADVLEANRQAGLPAIDVSEAQGKHLHLLARAVGARRVLEVGTLGGYSTIWLARAVGEAGKVVTLEADPHHARVAGGNFSAAGVAERIDLRVGPALATFPRLEAEGAGPFDLVFIDADKANNLAYVQWAVRLCRKGAVIIVDNVVRGGAIADRGANDASVAGTRAMFDWMSGNPALSATGVQTVGTKGWDGFVMAVVE